MRISYEGVGGGFPFGGVFLFCFLGGGGGGVLSFLFGLGRVWGSSSGWGFWAGGFGVGFGGFFFFFFLLGGGGLLPPTQTSSVETTFPLFFSLRQVPPVLFTVSGHNGK